MIGISIPMVSVALPASLLLSSPSLYLCYHLVRRGFLGTLPNKSAAVMFGFSGIVTHYGAEAPSHNAFKFLSTDL